MADSSTRIATPAEFLPAASNSSSVVSDPNQIAVVIDLNEDESNATSFQVKVDAHNGQSAGGSGSAPGVPPAYNGESAAPAEGAADQPPTYKLRATLDDQSPQTPAASPTGAAPEQLVEHEEPPAHPESLPAAVSLDTELSDDAPEVGESSKCSCIATGCTMCADPTADRPVRDWWCLAMFVCGVFAIVVLLCYGAHHQANSLLKQLPVCSPLCPG